MDDEKVKTIFSNNLKKYMNIVCFHTIVNSFSMFLYYFYVKNYLKAQKNTSNHKARGFL